MMGATCPDEVLLGTIRGDVVQVAGEDEAIQNIVHGSDSEVLLNARLPFGSKIKKNWKSNLFKLLRLVFGQLSVKKRHLS